MWPASRRTVGMQMDQKVVIAVLRGMSDEYPQLKQMLPPDPDHPAPAPSAGPLQLQPREHPTPNSAPAPSVNADAAPAVKSKNRL